jgi:hypothetical protein
VQRCPNCGYREKYDWPAMLLVVAFGVLYIVFIASVELVPRSYRLGSFAAFLLFLVANTWNGLRNNRNQREYLKLHPPAVTERVKDHIRISPSQ